MGGVALIADGIGYPFLCQKMFFEQQPKPTSALLLVRPDSAIMMNIN